MEIKKFSIYQQAPSFSFGILQTGCMEPQMEILRRPAEFALNNLNEADLVLVFADQGAGLHAGKAAFLKQDCEGQFRPEPASKTTCGELSLK